MLDVAFINHFVLKFCEKLLMGHLFKNKKVNLPLYCNIKFSSNIKL